MSTSWVTPEQAAARLEVHPDTIRRWIRAGAVQAHRIGVRWRIPLAELERLEQPPARKEAAAV